MVVMTVAITGITQIGLESNGFAFSNGKGTAVGIAAAVIQVGGGGNIGFIRTKQGHPQVITVSSGDAADEAAVSSAEFQCIVENIFQFQIPAAILQRIRFLSQNFDVSQFQITDGNVSGIAGRDNNISFTQHIVAAVSICICSASRAQHVGSQAFLDAALVKDFLGNDTGFAAAAGMMIAAVSCGKVKFKSSHKTASLKVVCSSTYYVLLEFLCKR